MYVYVLNYVLSSRSSNIFLSHRGCDFEYFPKPLRLFLNNIISFILCVFASWLDIYIFMVLSFPHFLFLSSPFLFLVCYKRELSCICISIIYDNIPHQSRWSSEVVVTVYPDIHNALIV